MTSFIDPQITLHLDYMEGELGKSAWFAGDDFTAADVQMSFVGEAARDGFRPDESASFGGTRHIGRKFQVAALREVNGVAPGVGGLTQVAIQT